MTLKARILSTAIQLTPSWIIRLIANLVLKDIAQLKFFHFDLPMRKVYLELQLEGEADSIEVWAEDFYMLMESGQLTVVLGQARSNRLWLTNLFGHVTGRSWKLPVPLQYAAYVELVAEVFRPRALALPQSIPSLES